MAKKDKKAAETYYEGLTFKEFRNAGKSGVELSDIAWAGRLFPRYPSLWASVNRLVILFCGITILSLAVVWFSILTRAPSLLMAVYPNGQVVCFPRLTDLQGRGVSLDRSYHGLCQTLNQRSGKMWQTENGNKKSDAQAVGNTQMVSDGKSLAVYQKISEMPEFNAAEPVSNDPSIPGGGTL